MKTTLYRIVSFLIGSLDWVFPAICLECSNPGTRLCAGCKSKVIVIKEPVCSKCGIPLVVSGMCRQCKQNPPDFEYLRSWAVYEGVVQKAIQRLKYKREVTLGFEIADWMDQFIKELNWKMDLMVAVPLGINRMRERGYNQASLIAYPLSLKSGIVLSRDGLRRIRETESQVGLKAIERRENLLDAFWGDPKQFGGKRVLLVDDVATTGATLTSCSLALKKAGAVCVNALTVARAVVTQRKMV